MYYFTAVRICIEYCYTWDVKRNVGTTIVESINRVDRASDKEVRSEKTNTERFTTQSCRREKQNGICLRKKMIQPLP